MSLTPNEEKLQEEVMRRVRYVSSFIGKYIEINKGVVELKEGSAYLIAEAYETIVYANSEAFVARELSSVCSALELSAVLVAPVVNTNGISSSIEENAKFAVQLAMGVLGDLQDLEAVTFPNREVTKLFGGVASDHRLMLESVIFFEEVDHRQQVFPLEANNVFWQGVEFVLQVKNNLDKDPKHPLPSDQAEEMSKSSEIEIREGNIEETVGHFVDYWEGKYSDSLEVSEDGVIEIAGHYYAIIDEYYKREGFVVDRIDFSKVCAATELAVLLVQPLAFSKRFKLTHVNAEMSFYIANIFAVGLSDGATAVTFSNVAFVEPFDRLLDTHRKIIVNHFSELKVSQKFEFILSSNSQFWKIVHFVGLVSNSLQAPP